MTAPPSSDTQPAPSDHPHGHGNARWEVEIADRQNIIPLDHDELRQVVYTVMEAEQVASARVSLALVTGRTMHRLNRQYLNHDYPTDVLSFLLECTGGPDAADETARPATPGDTAPAETAANPTDEAVPRGRGLQIEGEVIVSTEMARDRAAEFHWPPRSETVLYLIHGLLHLAGYDDRTDTERTQMRSRERTILALCGHSPPAPRAAAQPQGQPGDRPADGEATVFGSAES